MPDERSLTKLVRPLRGGQITIPVEFRNYLGIDDETMLRLTAENGEVRISAVRVVPAGPGSPWLRELYQYFAPVREEILERGISEEEIDADIDAAVRAARSGQRSEP